MIDIDKKKCVGCGVCAEVCPGNLIYLFPPSHPSEADAFQPSEKKSARLRDARDCWGCMACVKACPRQAIAYRLAADIGGVGTKLFAVDRKKTLTWRLEFPNGSTQQIVVDKTQSNQY